MALVVKQDKRIEHPTEPGTWAVIRVPLSAGDLGFARDGSAVAMTLDILPRVIVEWSYPEPVTRENVSRLDGPTFRWLDDEISSASAIRPEEEKKDSASPSSPTTEPDGDSSPPSSDI